MKPVIEVVVSPTGDIQIEAVAFQGSDCEKATRNLEEALGRCVQKQRKPEYHQTRSQSPKQRIVQ